MFVLAAQDVDAAASGNRQTVTPQLRVAKARQGVCVCVCVCVCNVCVCDVLIYFRMHNLFHIAADPHIVSHCCTKSPVHKD